MLADQLIYTACGKDKTGAFSVWSQSPSVTKPEADTIVKLMSYRKSNDAPFDPTEQEIKTLFPKKYAFFTLPTGRYCVAKTTYLGRVYSDLDARNGNFIIHAYIFNDLDVNPFFIFGSHLFRSELTYKEWHDDPAPDFLPQADIAFQPTAADAALRCCIQQGKLEQVKDIVQAIIDNAGTDKVISFNDTEENQAHIYALIGSLLPKRLHAQATFCTDYSPQMDYTLSGMNIKPPMLRNIFPDLLGSAFNYAEERDSGSVVFDFNTGIFTELTNGNYTDGFASVLGNNTGLFGAIRYSENVDSVMTKCGCDINTAASVYAFLNAREGLVADPAGYMRNVELAVSGGFIDTSAAAVKVYNAVVADRSRAGSYYAQLIRFAYANGDDRIKRGVYEYFASNLAQFGINMAGEPSATLEQIKSAAPFNWQDFAAATVRDSVWQRRLENSHSVNEVVYIYDAAAFAVGARLGEAEAATGYKMLASALVRSADRLATAEINLYLGIAAKYGLDTNWLFDKAFEKYTMYGAPDQATLDFVFGAACALSDEKKKSDIISKLIPLNIKNPFFMPVYAKYAATNKELFARLESTLISSSQGGADFVFQKDAYMFRHEPNITFDVLSTYFKKYYEKGYDREGVFAAKVKEYLAAYSGAARMNEALKIYQLVGMLADGYADVANVLLTVAQAAYALPLDDLMRLTERKDIFKEVCELNARVRNGMAYNANFCMFTTLSIMLGRFGWQYLQTSVAEKSLYNHLATPQMKNDFVNNCFDAIVDAYLSAKQQGVADCVNLFYAMFAVPFDTGCGARKLVDWLNADKRSAELFGDMMGVAFNYPDAFALRVNKFVQDYIGAMRDGDAKKLLKKAVGYVNNALVPNVNAYVDGYMNTHRSLFEKLFGNKDRK